MSKRKKSLEETIESINDKVTSIWIILFATWIIIAWKLL